MKRASVILLQLAIGIMGTIVFLLCVFWLPWLARHTAELFPEFAYLRYPVLIFLYVTAVPFYFALFQAFNLLRFIARGDAFSSVAVEALKTIKYCAVCVAILYVVGYCSLVTQNAVNPGIVLIAGVIICTSSVIALFSAVLQMLLRHALDIKTENELTV